MTRTGVALIGVMILAVTAIGFNNCSRSGGDKSVAPAVTQSTISGNPFGGTASGFVPAGAKVSQTLCMRMSACFAGTTVFNLTQDQCVSGVGTTAGVPQALGAPASVSDIDDLDADESDNTLDADDLALTQCLSDIVAESCTHVTSGYNQNLTNPFQNITVAIPNQPTSCAGIFGGSSAVQAGPEPSPGPAPLYEVESTN